MISEFITIYLYHHGVKIELKSRKNWKYYIWWGFTEMCILFLFKMSINVNNLYNLYNTLFHSISLYYSYIK